MSEGLPGRQQGISGFVLAGGRSRRLGQDKAQLIWKNGTLLDHAVTQLREVCETVAVCTARKDLSLGLPAIPDARPDSGPLGGLVSALEQSVTNWNFFLAVDLPLMPSAVLQWLARQARTATPEVRAIIPEVKGLPQPLCAVLHGSLAPGLRRALEEGHYKLMFAIGEAIREIPGATMEQVPLSQLAAACPQSPTPPVDWFLNVNTPEDWQRARELGIALE